ncbi:uncharacterized protein LOC111910474 [Lactuca sativa]|uniref:uncharacterized protein LOC111910474 n=1 Tax=Lactuca sativa TaxID=4236 RepID=UPI000CD8BC72|nr:uncharacterized protein LOC111910474 [Lactuca sativa]
MSASMSHSGLSSSNTSGIPSSLWILDSGASLHMSPHFSSFASLSSHPPVSVMFASATPMSVEGVDSIVTPYISLTNDIQYRRVIGIGRRLGELYVLEQLHVADVAASSVDLSSFRLNPSSSPFYLRHSRLGHVSASRLQFLVSTGVLGFLKFDDTSDCCGCKLGKFSALPFNKSVTRSVAPFDIEENLLPMILNNYWHLMALYINHLVQTLLNRMGESVHAATYVINRIPTAYTLGKSPYEMLFGQLPDYSSLQKGCRCYDPSNQKLYVSRNVTFLEHISFYSIPVQSHDATREELRTIDPFSIDINDPPHAADPTPIVDPLPANHQDPPPPRPYRNKKSTKLPDFVYSSYSLAFASFIANVHRLSEPTSYKEVVYDPLWQTAMAEELAALYQIHTWDPVPLPPEKHTIG